MITIIFIVTVLIYCTCIIMMLFEWRSWKEGFLENDGTFTSKYYQIAFYLMRTGCVVFMIGSGYFLYWIEGYAQIF